MEVKHGPPDKKEEKIQAAEMKFLGVQEDVTSWMRKEMKTSEENYKSNL